MLGVLGMCVLLAAATGIYFAGAATTEVTPAAARTSAHAFPFRLHAQPQSLPDVAFEDETDRKMTLARFRGKLVLLNVWATWCPPCRKEMPTLDRLQQQLGGDAFEVVALSVDNGGAAAVKDFYAQTGVHALSVYIDKSMLAASLLGVVGLPTTLLIDAQGREIGRKIGPAEWDSVEVMATIRRYLPADSPSRRAQPAKLTVPK